MTLDRDAIARRVFALNEALQDLADPDARDASRLGRDRRLRAAVERWLQISIEACIDIAFAVIAAREWTPPDSARGAFNTLAGHGLISVDLANRLALAAGLRNILVHEYVDVDLDRVARVVRENLGDLRAFAQAATGWS